jgi:ribosomal-protein-alanine N-acetyltransferase
VISVRRAREQDLPEIVEIEGLCFPLETAFPPGLFAFLIRNARTVVACDDQIRGFGIGYVSGHTGVINTLDVHPSYRRQGIGTMLVRALEEQFLAKGAVFSRLEVALENTAALSLYRMLGYTGDEILKDYYDSGKDAQRMWKRLV